MRKRRARGVSLVELMMAMGLLASGFLMVAGMFPTGLTALKKGESVLLATHLAQREMEKVKSTAYTSIASYSFTENLALTATGSQVTRTFSGSVQADYEPVPGRLREVVVMITWLEGGQARYVKLGTLLNRDLL